MPPGKHTFRFIVNLMETQLKGNKITGNKQPTSKSGVNVYEKRSRELIAANHNSQRIIAVVNFTFI
jgi:hypothetical protein